MMQVGLRRDGNEKAAGGVLIAKRAPHRPGTNAVPSPRDRTAVAFYRLADS
jgi:hypothetical protein